MISCASSLDVMLIADRLGVFSRGLFAANIARFTKPNKPDNHRLFSSSPFPSLPRDFIAAELPIILEKFLERRDFIVRYFFIIYCRHS